jgi:hypothetical protein
MAKAVILNKGGTTRKVEEKKYSRLKVIPSKRKVLINETLPFRIKITNITVPGYSATNVPGIGVQVIGFSNYIL